jgi:hypothetical protein
VTGAAPAYTAVRWIFGERGDGSHRRHQNLRRGIQWSVSSASTRQLSVSVTNGQISFN